MKKSTLLAGLIVCIFLISCKKDNVQSSNTKTSLSFLANNILVIDSSSTDSIFWQKRIVNGSNCYSLESKIDSIHYSILLLFITDTLEAKSYYTSTAQYPSGTTPTGDWTFCYYPGEYQSYSYPPQDYYLRLNGDFMSVNITSIQNNYTNGTFSGEMSYAFDTTHKISITNGIFKNVKILY